MQAFAVVSSLWTAGLGLAQRPADAPIVAIQNQIDQMLAARRPLRDVLALFLRESQRLDQEALRMTSPEQAAEAGVKHEAAAQMRQLLRYPLTRVNRFPREERATLWEELETVLKSLFLETVDPELQGILLDLLADVMNVSDHSEGLSDDFVSGLARTAGNGNMARVERLMSLGSIYPEKQLGPFLTAYIHARLRGDAVTADSMDKLLNALGTPEAWLGLWFGGKLSRPQRREVLKRLAASTAAPSSYDPLVQAFDWMEDLQDPETRESALTVISHLALSDEERQDSPDLKSIQIIPGSSTLGIPMRPIGFDGSMTTRGRLIYGLMKDIGASEAVGDTAWAGREREVLNTLLAQTARPLDALLAALPFESDRESLSPYLQRLVSQVLINLPESSLRASVVSDPRLAMILFQMAADPDQEISRGAERVLPFIAMSHSQLTTSVQRGNVLGTVKKEVTERSDAIQEVERLVLKNPRVEDLQTAAQSAGPGARSYILKVTGVSHELSTPDMGAIYRGLINRLPAISIAADRAALAAFLAGADRPISDQAFADPAAIVLLIAGLENSPHPEHYMRIITTVNITQPVLKRRLWKAILDQAPAFSPSPVPNERWSMIRDEFEKMLSTDDLISMLAQDTDGGRRKVILSFLVVWGTSNLDVPLAGNIDALPPLVAAMDDPDLGEKVSNWINHLQSPALARLRDELITLSGRHSSDLDASLGRWVNLLADTLEQRVVPAALQALRQFAPGLSNPAWLRVSDEKELAFAMALARHVRSTAPALQAAAGQIIRQFAPQSPAIRQSYLETLFHARIDAAIRMPGSTYYQSVYNAVSAALIGLRLAPGVPEMLRDIVRDHLDGRIRREAEMLLNYRNPLARNRPARQSQDSALARAS